MESQEYALMDAAEDRIWWYRALHRRMIQALDGVGVGGAVLDAGCGTGGLLARLRAARPDLALHGLEWSAPAAARAAAKSGARVVRGSINAMPWDAGRFDAVVSADVLCHQAVDVAAALAEVHRVLRPGGRLVLNLPAFRWLLSGHDRRVHNARRYTAGEVRALLVAHGFQAMRLRYWNSLLLPLMILRRKGPRRGAVDGGDVSDVAPFPPWQDAILFAATEIERRLALRPPAGGSVLAIATRL